MVEDYLRLVGQVYAVLLPAAALIDLAVWGWVAVFALRSRRSPTPAARRAVLAAGAVVVAGLVIAPSLWRAVAAWAVVTAGAILWNAATGVDTPGPIDQSE